MCGILVQTGHLMLTAEKKKEPVKFNFNNTLPGYSRRVYSGHLGKFDTGELGRMGFTLLRWSISYIVGNLTKTASSVNSCTEVQRTGKCSSHLFISWDGFFHVITKSNFGCAPLFFLLIWKNENSETRKLRKNSSLKRIRLTTPRVLVRML